MAEFPIYGDAMRILLFAILGLVSLFATVAVAADLLSRFQKPRGAMIDVGGRSLRLVCEGPKSGQPVIWMEAGAFSGAADFAALQQKLAAKGLRSCAYDRAGIGYSDPGPKPRDGNAIVKDLGALIAGSDERGPFILMGHSMAGLYLRQFAVQNPDKVAGLVLLDAVTPEMIGLPGADVFVNRMTTLARLGSIAGSLGLTKPFYLMGDRVGLPAEGRAEKRRGFINGRQSRTAYAEVVSWRAAGEQALVAGPLSPEWPIAVITAGPPSPQMDVWNEVRHAPARESRAGFIDNVDAASHTTMLGLTYGDRVVAGVEKVLAALSATSAPASRSPAGPGSAPVG